MFFDRRTTRGEDRIICTRAVYLGPEETVITGAMDWFVPMDTNLWDYPRGLERDCAAEPGSPRQSSKYGSVATAGYDAATVDACRNSAAPIDHVVGTSRGHDARVARRDSPEPRRPRRRRSR